MNGLLVRGPSRRIALLAVLLLWGCGSKPPADHSRNHSSEHGSLPNDASAWQILTLDDFEIFPADALSWSEEGGVIDCTGQPRGYLYSRNTWGDFLWEAEYRFLHPEEAADLEQVAASNTGFMIHIQEPHKVWPFSWEVQGKHSEMCSIKANGGAASLVIQDDPEARERARRPAGEWNQVRIVSRQGSLEAWLNGELICLSHPGELQSGRIGLQSEGFAVQFRDLRIRPLLQTEAL